MADFLFSVNVVLPLFILIAIGYIAKQLNFVSASFLSEANKFVFRFSLPLMLFRNIQSAFHGDFSNTRLLLSALIGVLFIITALLIIIPLLIKRQAKRGSLIQGIYRSNFLIYGVPLATRMYGDEAMAPVAMLMGVIIPVYNISATIILTVFSEKESKTLSFQHILIDIFRNPLIIACMAGGILGSMNFQFPEFIDKPLMDLAGIATPLALLVMGGEFRFKSLQNNFRPAIFASLSRLVVIPLIAMIVFIYMGFRNVELAVLLCLFGTPTAVTSFIMAENMGCDGELAAQIVVLTTAGSAFTIFVFVFALRIMGYI